MAPRIPPVPPDQRDAQTAELLDTLRRPDGSELNIFTTLAHHPKLLKRWSAFGGALLYRGELDPREREILILRTGWRCDAEYEWTQHVAIGRETGLTDAEIQALRDEEPALGESDLLLVRAADELHRSARISDPTWEQLAGRYSPAQLIELCMVVGQYHLVAFTLNSLGVELES
jgi:4-carboxymuconolactone decarboxylase